MLGIALLLSYARSVEVLIAMATADGKEKFLSHNLTLVSQRSKGGGTLWNMDKRGSLYRFRTVRHYAYVNGKGRLAMRDGGAKFKQIAEDEKIRLMQSIIGDDVSESSSDDDSSTRDSGAGSEDSSGDGESQSNDKGSGGRGPSNGDRRKIARDRAKRRKILNSETGKGGSQSQNTSSSKSSKRSRNESRMSENDDEQSDERDRKSGRGNKAGNGQGGKKNKKLPTEPIVDKGDMLLSTGMDSLKLRSKLLNGKDGKERPDKPREENSDAEENLADRGSGDDKQDEEDGEKSDNAAENEPEKTSTRRSRLLNADSKSNLLGAQDSLDAIGSQSFFGQSSPFLLDDNDLYFGSGGGMSSLTDAKPEKMKEEGNPRKRAPASEPAKSDDGEDEEEEAGVKSGAKRFLSNLVGAVTGSKAYGDSTKSALVEKRRVTTGPGFYFELIPVFKNKVDRGTLIVYRNECYTHNLRFEKCDYNSYWDLDSKYFWSIFPTSDNRYLGVLKSYIEKSEEKRRKLEALDCIKIDKCPPRVVCKPTIENSCPPQVAQRSMKPKQPGVAKQCAKGGANQCPAAPLLNCTQGMAAPLQRPAVPPPQRQPRAQRALGQPPAGMQQSMSQAGMRQDAAQQPCPPSACLSQGTPPMGSTQQCANGRNAQESTCSSDGQLSVTIRDGYKLEDSLGDKLIAAYKG